MPSHTFANLPTDKRARFVEAALREFATHSYDQASISRMVAELGIAKGSVYQYFSDKFDLFNWLVQESIRRKLEAIEELPEEGPVLDRLHRMYVAGLDWWRQAPLWARLPLRIQEPSREPRMTQLRERARVMGHDWIAGLLQEGVDRGELRADLDVDALAWLVAATLRDGLLDAFCHRLELSVDELLDPTLDLERPAGDAVLEVADLAIRFLKRGISRPSGP